MLSVFLPSVLSTTPCLRASYASCTMGMRFNSFYSEDVHPSSRPWWRPLKRARSAATAPRSLNYVLRDSQAKVQESGRVMKSITREVLEERKAHPTDKKDVLYHMLRDKDPKTGEQMSDESIMNNMITFLIAGNATHSLFSL